MSRGSQSLRLHTSSTTIATQPSVKMSQLLRRAGWHAFVILSAQVELQVDSIHVISRAEPLPFEVIDASRGDEEVAAAAAKGERLSNFPPSAHRT